MSDDANPTLAVVATLAVALVLTACSSDPVGDSAIGASAIAASASTAATGPGPANGSTAAGPTGTDGPTGSPSADPHASPPAEALRQLPGALARYARGASRADLTGNRIHAWISATDFTLEVTFTLHFPTGDTGPFDEGANTRFVHFVKNPPDADYTLTWASGP